VQDIKIVAANGIEGKFDGKRYRIGTATFASGLYTGIPIVMNVPKECGFLFASAVLAFCMVLLMIIMGGSVIL